MPTSDLRSRLDHATRDLDAPVAVVDLDAFDANADDLLRRASGVPVRVASKSLRCRALLRRVLARDGFEGVLAYSLSEALRLAEDVEDVLVGYPTAERSALRTLVVDERALSRVTLMVDDPAQLDLVDAAVGRGRAGDVRVCLDLDASYRRAGGRVHLGPRRSPVHSVDDAVRLARAVVGRDGFRLVGLMAYEGQVAGLQDRPVGNPLRGKAVRTMKSLSVEELAERRAAVVAAVRAVADLEIVNGGGTGSLETTVREGVVTEVAAGSGLYAPALFDGYDAFRARPAAFFGLDVTRRPAPGVVTVSGGGWVASGPAGRDRLPVPALPQGLRLLGAEGAGEVQTPLTGAPARRLAVGDRVWFRHAKAGELCERVEVLHLVQGDAVVETVPTYRGEGMTSL